MKVNVYFNITLLQKHCYVTVYTMNNFGAFELQKLATYCYVLVAWRLCARLWIERSGFEPWPGTLYCVLRLCYCIVFLGKTVSLSTQVYKWVPVNLMLGTSTPSRGE